MKFGKLIGKIVFFLYRSGHEFFHKNGPYMSAAISYYAFFAIFPLLIGIITVFSFFLRIEGLESRIIDGLQHQIPVLNEADDEFYGDILVETNDNHKCDRCWHKHESVGSIKGHEKLCNRCHDNIFGDGEKRLLG